MNQPIATSPNNPVIKNIRILQENSGRQKQEKFLIEGINCLDEAINFDCDLESLVINESSMDNESVRQILVKSKDKTKPLIVTEALFKTLTTTSSQCHIMAIVRKLKYTVQDCLESIKKGPLLILDCIQDPGNLGSLLRIASGFDVSGIILLKGCVDIYNPKVIRSSAGHIFQTPFIYMNSTQEIIALIKENKLILSVLTPTGNTMLCDTHSKAKRALVLGNEGHGINDELLANAYELIKIPTSSRLESLNVTISAAIALNHWWSERHGFKA